MPETNNQLYIYIKENPANISADEKLNLCIASAPYEILTPYGSKTLIFRLSETFISRININLEKSYDPDIKNLAIRTIKETHLSVPDNMDFTSPKAKLPTQFHVTLYFQNKTNHENFKLTLYFNLEGKLLETNFSEDRRNPTDYRMSEPVIEKISQAILNIKEFSEFIKGLHNMIILSDAPSSINTPDPSDKSDSAASSKKSKKHSVIGSEKVKAKDNVAASSSSAVDTTTVDAIKIYLNQCQGLLQNIIADPDVSFIDHFKIKFPINTKESDYIQHFADLFLSGDNDLDPTERRKMAEDMLNMDDDAIMYVIQHKIMELYSKSVCNNRHLISEYESELDSLIAGFVQEKHERNAALTQRDEDKPTSSSAITKRKKKPN